MFWVIYHYSMSITQYKDVYYHRWWIKKVWTLVGVSAFSFL